MLTVAHDKARFCTGPGSSGVVVLCKGEIAVFNCSVSRQAVGKIHICTLSYIFWVTPASPHSQNAVESPDTNTVLFVLVQVASVACSLRAVRPAILPPGYLARVEVVAICGSLVALHNVPLFCSESFNPEELRMWKIKQNRMWHIPMITKIREDTGYSITNSKAGIWPAFFIASCF
mgnify:CR=1 FL=1